MQTLNEITTNINNEVKVTKTNDIETGDDYVYIINPMIKDVEPELKYQDIYKKEIISSFNKALQITTEYYNYFLQKCSDLIE